MKHNIENIRLIYLQKAYKIFLIIRKESIMLFKLYKVFMYKWFLQGFLFLLSRLPIPLQAAAVIGQKVDIQSALIAFLHNTNI